MTRHTTQAGPGSEFFTRTRFIQPPVAPESLVAWYPFRSGTGADITAGDSDFGDSTDYSATVNGATFLPSGGVRDITTGPNSGAFDFDGVDDELDAGASQALVPQSFTLIAVTKADVTKDNMRVVHTRDIDKGGYTLTNDGDRVKLETFSNGNFFVVDTTKNVQGDFVTIAGSYDNGTARVNLNGGQQIASNSQPYDNTNFTPFEIAPAGEFGSPRFDGVIDEVRLYSPALSQSQINLIHNNVNP